MGRGFCVCGVCVGDDRCHAAFCSSQRNLLERSGTANLHSARLCAAGAGGKGSVLGLMKELPPLSPQHSPHHFCIPSAHRTPELPPGPLPWQSEERLIVPYTPPPAPRTPIPSPAPPPYPPAAQSARCNYPGGRSGSTASWRGSLCNSAADQRRCVINEALLAGGSAVPPPPPKP